MRVHSNESRIGPFAPQSRSAASTSPRSTAALPTDRFEARSPTQGLSKLGVATFADPVTVRGSAAPNAAINDNSKVESLIRLDADLDVSQLALNLDIQHPYRGDLVVTLTS